MAVVVKVNGETMEFPEGTTMEEINQMMAELQIPITGQQLVQSPTDSNVMEYQSPRGENGL